MTGSFFINYHMTRISDNWTKSRISTFNGETAGNNADKNPASNLIWLEESLSIIGSKI